MPTAITPLVAPVDLTQPTFELVPTGEKSRCSSHWFDLTQPTFELVPMGEFRVTST